MSHEDEIALIENNRYAWGRFKEAQNERDRFRAALERIATAPDDDSPDSDLKAIAAMALNPHLKIR